MRPMTTLLLVAARLDLTVATRLAENLTLSVDVIEAGWQSKR